VKNDWVLERDLLIAGLEGVDPKEEEDIRTKPALAQLPRRKGKKASN